MSCPVCRSNSYSKVTMPLGGSINPVGGDISLAIDYSRGDLVQCNSCHIIFIPSEDEGNIPPLYSYYCKDCEHCDLILGAGNIIGVYGCVNPESDHDQHLFLNGHKACSLFKQKEK